MLVILPISYLPYLLKCFDTLKKIISNLKRTRSRYTVKAVLSTPEFNETKITLLQLKNQCCANTKDSATLTLV